jgi:hypothetical protein
MKNLLSAAGAAFVLASAFSGPAAAQNQILGGQPIMNSTSANDMLRIFSGIGLSGKVAGTSADSQILEFQSETGFVMYVGLVGCDGATASASCAMAQPYAIFDNGGVTLNDVNDFNFSQSTISMLMVAPDGRLIIGSRVIFDGGITEANFRTNAAMFLLDAATLMQGVSPGLKATVSYDPLRTKGMKAAGAIEAPADAARNSLDQDGGAVAALARALKAEQAE